MNVTLMSRSSTRLTCKRVGTPKSANWTIYAVAKKSRRYQSFLLRLWQSDEAGRLVWRASLESADGGQRHGFSNLHGLFAYLEAVCQAMEQHRETGSSPTTGQDENTL